MRYSSEIIEKVRDASDIVDVVGQYVRLTRKGSNYFGLCPFHGEKTPSFSVSPQKQIYYCFGCGKGGSVFDFLCDYENLSFQEALKQLAERAGIDLPQEADGEDARDAGLSRALLAIHKDAALYYVDLLRSPDGKAGYQYLREKRGLSDRTILRFGLGFTGKRSDGLYRYLREKGWNDEQLSRSGLCIIDERRPRDRFFNRVMFPIMDTANRVIAFGGRVMGDGEPKYLNSPETPIFNKSRTLYGLNYARKSRADCLLLCEGYMDVISLHQAGFTNAVAALGTAFNEKHASVLKRFTGNVILTQDEDEAGIRAKLRAFPVLRDAGLNVKVLSMEDCKDPDEYIRKHGRDAYENCIKKAQNAFLYEAEVLKRSYDLADPAGKTGYYRALADRLAEFSEPLERKNYIEAVARIHLIPAAELTELVDRSLAKKGVRRKERRFDAEAETAREEAREQAEAEKTPSREQEPAEPVRRAAPDPAEKAALRSQRLLLCWLVQKPAIRSRVFLYIDPEDFTARLYRELAEKIRSSGDAELRPAALLERYTDENEKKLVAAVLNADTAFRTGEELTDADFRKALSEAVRTVLGYKTDLEIGRCGQNIVKLQQLLNQKQQIKLLDIDLS